MQTNKLECSIESMQSEMKFKTDSSKIKNHSNYFAQPSMFLNDKLNLLYSIMKFIKPESM